MEMLFSGFRAEVVDIGEVRINCRVGGSGPPLMLLHGCPQTHVMWHKIAPTLAREFTVVASDLRGYGDSSKPIGSADHSNYSFRSMAADQIELMSKLGFAKFAAVGHDRGARVLHRMALDWPDVLERAALLDILPTAHLYTHTDRLFATRYWEWFFFIQDGGFPEALLAGNPEAFLRYELGGLHDGAIVPEAWNEYLRVLSDPAAMHGMCEDYRAGASIDLEHDAIDAGRQVHCPLLVLWGDENPIWQRFDVLEVWQRYATSVVGAAIRSGHYLAEEAPDQLLTRLSPFLSA
jgi:haloacetate dehalogenase